jgi:hypothetical protein
LEFGIVNDKGLEGWNYIYLGSDPFRSYLHELKLKSVEVRGEQRQKYGEVALGVRVAWWSMCYEF